MAKPSRRKADSAPVALRAGSKAAAVKPPAPAAVPPDHHESLVNAITTAYPALSGRYQQVARYLTQNPNIVAFESLNSIGTKCGAHPSILVRFAQHFG
jgi:hypothetical protein